MTIKNIVTFRKLSGSKKPSDRGLFLTVYLVSYDRLLHLEYMKKKILIPFICLFAITISSCAQVKKVYAYKQASIPGILPASDENDIKENNSTKKTEWRPNYNYWFYLSITKTEKITVTGLWIDGKQYDIRSETITSLPVKKIVFTGLEKNDTTTMVPVTGNKVILIYPAAEKPGDSKYALNFARTNELVIRYTSKGKIHYTTVKKIKELDPDVRQ